MLFFLQVLESAESATQLILFHKVAENRQIDWIRSSILSL